MQEYYTKKDIAFQKIPPHNPECEQIFKGEGPKITSPVNGTEYYINSKDPEPILLTARPATMYLNCIGILMTSFIKQQMLVKDNFLFQKKDL